MKSSLLILFCFAVINISIAQDDIPSPEAQIKSAVMAAPADKRDGATVYGYNENNELVVLREGTNEMICLADDPKQSGFNASCFHKELESFMTRGWDLRKEGKSSQEIFDMREEEVKSGKLEMPENGSTLFVYSASEENYNKETGEVKDGNFRYVVYIPFATSESTGLPLKPEAPGMPWIMDPGTHRAHIMINPPADK
ncbi:hypothetical protein BH23BAC1_BH23BAC1_05150 [soil metagenome]